MPGVSRVPFEAHPFTIASIPRHGSFMKANSPASSEEKVGEESATKGGNELVFFIKVKEGFTKRLREAVERKDGDEGRMPLSVYVDGPYGSPPDVNAFDSVILIAGEHYSVLRV
jgi:ferric-chelate reductase